MLRSFRARGSRSVVGEGVTVKNQRTAPNFDYWTRRVFCSPVINLQNTRKVATCVIVCVAGSVIVAVGDGFSTVRVECADARAVQSCAGARAGVPGGSVTTAPDDSVCAHRHIGEPNEGARDIVLKR